VIEKRASLGQAWLLPVIMCIAMVTASKMRTTVELATSCDITACIVYVQLALETCLGDGFGGMFLFRS